MESLSPGFEQMTVQLLPPAQRQRAGSVQLTKWCSLSRRPESLHPLPQLRSLLSPRHASLSKDSSAPLLAGLPTPVHFCPLPCMHLFIFAFSFIRSVPSCPFLGSVRLEETWRQRGSSRVTHQLWNLGMSRRQRETMGEIGERMKDEDEGNRQKRCCADR